MENKKKIDYLLVKEMYEQQGLTYKEIGVKFNCSDHTIRKIAKRHGVKSIRGTSKARKIIIQKSSLPLSLKETPIYDFLENKEDTRYMEVILGGLLGDSYIKPRENKESFSYNVIFAHCKEQLPYLEYKHSILSEFGLVNPIRLEHEARELIVKGKTSNVQALYAFSTTPFDSLSKVYDMLIVNGKKTITKKYLELLTPLSLAIWHMDDGSFNVQNRVIRIATMCFSLEEHDILLNYFNENLRMPCFLEKVNCGTGVSLVLTQNSSKKFIDLTRPYMCEAMAYKFPNLKNPFTLIPSETLKAECNNSVSKEIVLNKEQSNIAEHLHNEDDGIVRTSMKIETNI